MLALRYSVNPSSWLACICLKPFWRGCVLSRLGGLALVETPPPELPGPGWVKLRTRMGGICGSDVALVAQTIPFYSLLQAYSSMPMLLGHESVAEVVEVGEGADASWLGRRVCVDPTLGCEARGIQPPCPRCAAGEYGACENFAPTDKAASVIPAGTSTGYNSRTGGSQGEFFVAHQSQLVGIPAAIDDKQAVLTDVLACGLHAVLRADLSAAQRVLVYGLGSIGLGVIAALRAAGFAGRVDAIGRHAHQADCARRLGADEVLALPASNADRYERIASRTGGSVHCARFGNRMLSGGYDVTFECVGSKQSVRETMRWTRSRGQMVMVATAQGGGVDLTPIWFTELTVLGAYGRQVESFAGRRIRTYELVHEWLVSGKLSAGGLLTHTFALAQHRQAYSVAMNKSGYKAIKVAFDFGR